MALRAVAAVVAGAFRAWRQTERHGRVIRRAVRAPRRDEREGDERMEFPELRLDLLMGDPGTPGLVKKAQYVESHQGMLFTVTIVPGKKLDSVETVKLLVERHEDPMRNEPRLPLDGDPAEREPEDDEDDDGVPA